MIALAAKDRPFSEMPTPVANMGGPRSRHRTEWVSSSLLGGVDGLVRCPRIRVVGFVLEDGCDPVARAYHDLESLGCQSPEELRNLFDVPPGPRLVAPNVAVPTLSMASLADEAFLAEALVLGLCTKTVYDPRRPVVWTRASLSRSLGMFQTGGFYALD
jgi:hypothetical protein